MMFFCTKPLSSWLPNNDPTDSEDGDWLTHNQQTRAECFELVIESSAHFAPWSKRKQMYETRDEEK